MKLFNKKRSRVAAVVVSAGNAVRMNGIDKPFLDIGGVPVIVRTLCAFEECDAIDTVILVCREDSLGQMLELTRDYNLHKVEHITSGGSTRQQSVFKGIASLPDDIEYIAIHDGARPFVSQNVINRCIDDAINYGSASAGIKVKDTIKMVGNDGFIMSTPPRELLYATQTPQIFEISLYKRAMENAVKNNLDFTDDCQLVEALGEKVYMSESEYINIKLTTPEDIAIAQIIADNMD